MAVGSETLGTAVLVLSTDSTKLDRGLKRAQTRAKAIGAKMRRVGRQMSTALTLPIVGFGVAILKAAAGFEKGMNQVQALTGATGKELTKLSDLAKVLGATTQFSAGQAADAMGFLAQAGLKTNQILGTMPATLNLAAASGNALADTADKMTNIMQAFNIEAAESARVADILTMGFTNSNTNLSELAEAVKFAGPVMKGFNVSLEETVAALGIMAGAGIKASMAGTSLRGAMVRLANPTKEISETLVKMGANFRRTDGSLKGMIEIVRELERTGASTSQMMKIFGQRAGPAMVGLVAKGSAALETFTRKLEKSGGKAKEIADVQMKGLSGAMKALKSALEAVAIAIADSGLLEWVTDMATAMANWLREMAKTNPVLLKWIVIIAGVAAALGLISIALGVMIPLLTTVTVLIGLISLPLLIVIAIIGLLVAAWWWLRDDTISVWDELVFNAKAWWAAMKIIFFDPVMKAITDLVNAWHAMLAFFTKSGINTRLPGGRVTGDNEYTTPETGYTDSPSMGDKTIGSGRDEDGRIVRENDVNINIQGGDNANFSGRQVRQLVERIAEETRDDSTRNRIRVVQ